MGTSDETLQKIFNQKGQGMLEYALILSFIAAVFIVVFPEGFSSSITGTFDNAAELLASASEEADFEGGSGGGSSGGTLLGSLLGGGDSNSGGSESSDVEEQHSSIAYIASDDYVPLDWHTVINDIKFAYGIVVAGTNPDLSIRSEYNLFSALGGMVSGTREYNYNDNDVKGWNDLMDTMGGQIADNNFTTSYVKGNESLDIKREGNKIVMKYTKNSGAKIFSIYADANRTMHFESNTNSDTAKALEEYSSLAGSIRSGGWAFNTKN